MNVLHLHINKCVSDVSAVVEKKSKCFPLKNYEIMKPRSYIPNQN